MEAADRDQAMRAGGVLAHEVPAGGRVDREEFDRVNYSVGRGVLDPDVLREVRGPWIDLALEDGYVEPVEGEPDLFRWIGGDRSFDWGRAGPAIRDLTEDRLIRTGASSGAIETLWGRRAAFWTPWGNRKYAMLPGQATAWHRDGWMLMGRGAPGDYVNIWIPLTKLGPGDGQLGLALGSRSFPGEPGLVPTRCQFHLEAHLDNAPPDEVVAPLWATTSFDVGDALLFDPYMVHSAVPNDGPYLRLALAMLAQDAAVSLTPRYGLSTDITRELTDPEWLTLALLAVQPCTRWSARQSFYGRGFIGRMWMELPDDLIDRAFTTLHARELVEPHDVQAPGNTSIDGIHHYFHITPIGEKLVCEWLTTAELSDPRLLGVRLQLCTWLNLDPSAYLSAGTGAGR